MTPFPVILSSPSGGGKTTIAKLLLARRNDVGYSVSCTTRPPRAGEEDGRDYHFVTGDDFLARRSRDEFAEFAEVHGLLYGTLRSEVERVLVAGQNVVMDIDVQGARQFSASFPESVLIFLLPPTGDVLLARLRGRKTETPEVLRRRLRSAMAELEAAREYHYVVLNDDLEHAYAQVAAIIDAETVRHDRALLLGTRLRDIAVDLERKIAEYTQPE